MKKLILSSIVLLSLFTGCYMNEIESGKRGIETTWGKITKSDLKPGLHWSLVPGTDLIVMNLRVKKLEMKAGGTNYKDTKDNIYDKPITILTDNGLPINVEMSILYKAKENNLKNLYKNYGPDIIWDNKLVIPAVRDVVREVLGHANIYEMNKNRDKYAKIIIRKLNDKIGKYVDIEQVSIRDIKLPKKIQQAIERKIQMKEEAAKAKFEVLKAQQEAQKAIAIAKGQAEKKKIEVNMYYYQVKKQADAQAYKLMTLAKAKAKSNELISKSLTDRLIKLKTIEKWNGNVPQFDGTGKFNLLIKP